MQKKQTLSSPSYFQSVFYHNNVNLTHYGNYLIETEKRERRVKGERKSTGQEKGEGGNRKGRSRGDTKCADSLLSESFPTAVCCQPVLLQLELELGQ